MAPRRVAITGLGMISPLGLTVADNWSSLSAGRPAIGPIESADCSTLRFKNGAEVRGYDPLKYFSGGKDAYIDRFAQFSLIAAREALENSGVELTPQLRENSAIVCGSAVGGQATIEAGFEDQIGRAHV